MSKKAVVPEQAAGTIADQSFANQGAQVTSDLASGGHYESRNGQPVWISGKDETVASSRKEGTRIIPRPGENQVEQAPAPKGGTPHRVESEDKEVTRGRHSR